MNNLFAVVVGAVAIAGSAQGSLQYATSVAWFDQGFKKDGGAVPKDRSITSNALGAPQNNDTMNFVSLGMGGEITLEFGARFFDSVTVWETTFGNPAGHKEAATVWVGVGPTADVATFWLVGLLQNTADGVPMSLAQVHQDSGLSGFRFVKIVDETNPAFHNGSGDGFDVDAVGVRVVPAPSGVAMAALGAMAFMRRRRAS